MDEHDSADEAEPSELPKLHVPTRDVSSKKINTRVSLPQLEKSAQLNHGLV